MLEVTPPLISIPFEFRALVIRYCFEIRISNFSFSLPATESVQGRMKHSNPSTP
jgi:hypothetical protein